jgi:hypothetical protein
MSGNICYAGERFGNAAIYTYSSGVSVVCTSANVYYQVANLVQGHWTAVDGDLLPAAATASFTVLRTGCYTISFSVSASSNKVAKLHADVFVNGVEEKQIAAERDISTVGQVGNFGASGNRMLQAGDIVTIKIESDTNATIVTFEHLNIHIKRASRP